MAKVLKAFNTRNRRFAIGAEVSAGDIAGPVGYDVLVARGFIEGEQPAPKPVSMRPRPAPAVTAAVD